MADEKTTIVRTGGSGGAIALIFGVIVILVVLYVIFGTNLLRQAPQKIDADVKVSAPKTS